MIRIDAHHHLWNLSARPQAWLDAPELEPLRRDFGQVDLRVVTESAGVDATVLVQVLADVGETEEFLALAGQSDLIAGVVGWVDLTAPDVAEQVDRLRRGPGGDRLVGVRHLVEAEPDPDWLVRPDVLAGLRAVRDAGLVYDLLTRPHQLTATLEAVRAVPDLLFVVDHLAKPDIACRVLQPWATRLSALAAEPNVLAKVSGLVTEAQWSRWTALDLRPYVDVALEAFGPDRLMVGSDWPVCLLAADYDHVLATAVELLDECSAAERDQVLGGTATRVYRLGNR
ncbi:amidohydrolase family protein [Nonomuraea sp. NPDC049637]|uniref:amidohydrolase family protein n=1 Tax=Nonomuraea sp. NPDC049637 TaxID=3154356 RepID=UPI00343AA02B